MTSFVEEVGGGFDCAVRQPGQHVAAWRGNDGGEGEDRGTGEGERKGMGLG